MTFHPFSFGSGLRPTFDDSRGERFHDFCFPQDRNGALYGHLPNFGVVPSENVGFFRNETQNIPHSSFSSNPYCHLPYANHAAMPGPFRSNPTAPCSGHMYTATPSGCSSQFPGYHYNMRRSSAPPESAYSGFLQEVDRKCLASCSYGLRPKSAGSQFAGNGYAVTSPTMMPQYRWPAYRYLSSNEVPESGCSVVGPRDYSVDEISRNAGPTSMRPEDGDWSVFSCFRTSSVGENNTRQWPSFYHRNPQFRQSYTPCPNVDESGRIGSFFESGSFGSNFSNEPETASHPGPSEVSSSAARMLPDCAVNGCESIAHVDPKSAPSTVAVTSSVSEMEVTSFNADLPTGRGVVFQTVPDVLRHAVNRETFTPPFVTTSDCHIGGITSSFCSKISSDSAIENAVEAVFTGTGVGNVNVEVSEQVGFSDVPTCTFSSTASAVNVPVGTTFASAAETVHPEHHFQLQEDGTDKTRTNSGFDSTPAIICGGDALEVSREPLSEGAPAAKPQIVDCDGDSSDDEVIIVSTSLPDVAACATNSRPNILASHGHGVQLACMHQCSGSNRMIHSGVRCTVPNCSSVRLRPTAANAVFPRHNSLPVPTTSDCLRTSGNRDVFVPTCAKRTAGQSYSVPDGCYRLADPRSSTSDIPRGCGVSGAVTDRRSSTVFSTCSSTVCRHPSATVQRGAFVTRPSLQRMMSVTPAATGRELSVRADQPINACRPITGSRRFCGPGSVHAVCQHAGLQRPAALTSTLPQTGPIPQRSAVRAPSKNFRSLLLSQFQRNSASSATVTRYGPRPPGQCATCKGFVAAAHCCRHPSTFHGAPHRHTGTHSVRAAHLLLQKVRQAKLSEFSAAAAAHRHHLLRRAAAWDPMSVIDLTSAVDDDDDAAGSDIPCEAIFARTRRRRLRAAGLPLLCRTRQLFFRRKRLADGSCCHVTRQLSVRAFPADSSLPFYRCFVKQLLRNFKFSASTGAPAKMYPEIPEFPPSAATTVASSNRGVRGPGGNGTVEDLVGRRRAVVLLTRLDPSVVNEDGSVSVDASPPGIRLLAAGPASRSVDASGNSRPENPRSPTLRCEQGSPASPQNGVGACVLPPKTAEPGRTDEAHIPRELAANGRRRTDELLALCRPLSVVLERLDRIKVRHHPILSTVDDRGPRHRRIVEPETAPVELRRWTVTRLRRSDTTPILLIRSLESPDVNSPRRRKAEARTDSSPHRLTSSPIFFRNRTVDVRRLRSLANASDFAVPEKAVSKRAVNWCRKRLRTSVSVVPLRSGNYMRKLRRRRVMLARAQRSDCPTSLRRRCLRKFRQLSELTAKIARRDQKARSVLRHPFSETTSSLTLAERTVNAVPLDSAAPKNVPLQPSDLVFEARNFRGDPEELARHRSTDVVGSVYPGASTFIPDSLPKSVFNSSPAVIRLDVHHRSTNAASYISERPSPVAVQFDEVQGEVVHIELNPDYASDSDLSQDSGSDDDTVALSPRSSADDADQVCSAPVSLTSFGAVPPDPLMKDEALNVEKPEDCPSAGSSTVVTSPHSSMDDLTIEYRSPVSDVLDADDYPLLDDQEKLDSNFQAGIGAKTRLGITEHE